MDFQNKRIKHSFREMSTFSLISGSNLIFINKPDEDNVTAPVNTLLLNGLQNNIDELDLFLENERDLKKREELEAKRLKCIEALQARQKPVTDVSELNDAVDQIESDQRLINSISSKKLDQVDLNNFLSSGMMPFVDSRFETAINKAFGQMCTNDKVQSVLGRNTEHRFMDADNKWIEFKNDVEQGISDLETEKAEINSRMASASTNEKISLRHRLKDIESESRLYKEQIEEGRAAWTHKEREKGEDADASRSVLDSVEPEVLEKLKLLLVEAQAIRTEKVQEYLGGEFEKLEQQMAEPRIHDMFSPKILRMLEAELAESRTIIVSGKITDPKVLRKLAEGFKKAKVYLSTNAEELRGVRENRAEIESQIVSGYSDFTEALAKLTPEKIQQITERYREEAAAQKIKEDSGIFKTAMNAMSQLSDPTSSLHTQMAEISERLAKISEMDPEELLAFKQELEMMKPRMEFLRNIDANLAETLSPNNQDAKLAHKTIKDLETAQTPEEIKQILESNLGAEHLELVSHTEFEKNYRKYTDGGHMVFQEKEDHWKIILDESALKSAESVKEIKKQITHELLHLEFEKGKGVKAEVRKALVESDPKRWNEIREAYLKMVWQKYKTPPRWTKEDEKLQDNVARKARFKELWTDDDILSELYAMQNELGQTWSKGHSFTDKLNNLLVGAGVGAAIGDIAEKTREYAKDAEEKVRGYAGGVEEEEKQKKEGSEAYASQSQENAVYKKNSEKIQAISDRIKEIKKSEFLSAIPGAGELVNAMEGYNNSTADLNGDLSKNPESGIIAVAVTSRIDKVSGDLKEIEDHVGKAARKAPNNEIGILRNLWINTTFNSIGDFVQMGKDAYEFLQRRHKRNVADHAAGLGMALFHGTDIGREALARKHKAESEEVNEWKNRYEHLDAWHLMAELKEIAHGIDPNKDQLKAIIRILASKGRLNWRNQDLWIALNKLQSAVVLKPGDKLLLHDPILLSQRLHRALGEVYDYDEYTSLERTQGSSYSSEKSKYDPIHKRMQDKLTPRLDELLAQHKNGEQVDPIVYESIIEYCIKNGKSYAENVMFHLIAGMATGLLGCDRGLALGEHLNLWPCIDWFPTRQPPYSTADWEKLCKQNFADSYKNGTVGKDFMNWYWTEIQNSKPVIERVKKTAGDRGWDHDWGRSIACLGDANSAKRFFSGRSGQEETKATAVGNAYVGAVQWIEENAKNAEFASKDQFARMAGWVAMSEGMLNGTAYRKKGDDINTRANEAMDRDTPREASFGNHKNSNTGEHRKMAAKFLFMIDPEFFGIFHGRDSYTDEQKKALGTAAKNYLIQADKYPELAEKLAEVEMIDQIYDRIDLIITTIFSHMSDADFKNMLSRLKSL